MGEGAKGETGKIEVIPADVPTCACKLPNRETERDARREFPKDYGDDLPDFVSEDMAGDELRDNWTTLCDRDDPTPFVAIRHCRPLVLVVYVDIRATESKVAELMDDGEANRKHKEVWTIKKLFEEVFRSIQAYTADYKSRFGEVSLPDDYWMLKLLGSLREWRLPNLDMLGAS